MQVLVNLGAVNQGWSKRVGILPFLRRALIEKCRNEYEYDLPSMIQDARNGKISVAPLPIRFIYKLLRPRPPF
jgi:hypothetical protein